MVDSLSECFAVTYPYKIGQLEVDKITEERGCRLRSALVSCSVELAPERSKTLHSDE